MSLPDALSYARLHRPRFVRELKDFIRFPTVAAQPRHAQDMRRCAAWLAAHLREIGLRNVRIVPTTGHPVVYGDWRRAPGKPTVLIYGHYDVQPADPLSEWRSPPFEPTVRGQDLFGRGASDDKGQVFTHLKALQCLLRTDGRLPVNVKCLLEGEEEIGSSGLVRLIARNRRALAADVAVISDTQMLGLRRPAINHSERGSLSLELELTGPAHDLHSGVFGGAIHNPLQALCEMIARMHDAGGRVAIPGFYRRVRRWSGKERAYMARIGPSNEKILSDAGAKSGWGEREFTAYEQTTIRPSLTVNGISGGYQGPGGKGVIPARAMAKISFRLAADQDPREIDRLFRRYVARITPPTIQSAVRTLSSARPATHSLREGAMAAAIFAYRKGFGATPVFLRSGGTIPVVTAFQETLSTPVVMMGFALPDDNIHAPNEKFHLPVFYRGIETSLWFLAAVGARRQGISDPQTRVVREMKT